MSAWVANCYSADTGLDGSGNPISATSIVANLSHSAPVGDTILLAILGGGGKTISSVVDSQGNTWTVDQSLVNGTVETAAIARCNVTAALGTTDTITITFSGTNAFHMANGDLYAGTLLPDVGATCTPATTTAPTTAATAATGHSVETVFAAAAIGGGKTRPTFTPGSGYATRQNNTAVNNTSNTGRDLYSIDLTTSAPGAQTASGTLSVAQPWDIVVETYFASGGGGGTSQTLLAGAAVPGGGTGPSAHYPGFALRASGPDITSAASLYPWAKTVNLLQNWSAIEATDNTFSFASLDASMQYAITNGIQCGIRIEMGLDGAPSWIYSANSIGAVRSLTTYTGPSDSTGAQTPVPWDTNLRALGKRLLTHLNTYLQTTFSGKKYADVCAFVAVSTPTALPGTEMTIGDEGDSRNTAAWNAVLNGQAARQAAYGQAWINCTLDALNVITGSVPISVASGTVWGDSRSQFNSLCDYMKANLSASQLDRLMCGPTDLRTDQPGAVSYAAWSSAADLAIKHTIADGIRTWGQTAGWSWWSQTFNGGTLNAIETAWYTDGVGQYQMSMVEGNTQILGNVSGLPAFCQNVLQPAILAQQPVGGGGATGGVVYGPSISITSGTAQRIFAGYAPETPSVYGPLFGTGARTILAGVA